MAACVGQTNGCATAGLCVRLHARAPQLEPKHRGRVAKKDTRYHAIRPSLVHVALPRAVGQHLLVAGLPAGQSGQPTAILVPEHVVCNTPSTREQRSPAREVAFRRSDTRLRIDRPLPALHAHAVSLPRPTEGAELVIENVPEKVLQFPLCTVQLRAFGKPGQHHASPGRKREVHGPLPRRPERLALSLLVPPCQTLLAQAVEAVAMALRRGGAFGKSEQEADVVLETAPSVCVRTPAKYERKRWFSPGMSCSRPETIEMEGTACSVQPGACRRESVSASQVYAAHGQAALVAGLPLGAPHSVNRTARFPVGVSSQPCRRSRRLPTGSPEISPSRTRWR